VMGQFMATTGRAGFAGTNESNMRSLANVFGVGRTGQGLQQIGAILESAMFRGARRGSLVLEQGAGRIAREAAALGVIGGLSMESAFQTVQQIEERVVQGANRPQGPLDIMSLRRIITQNEDVTNLFEAQEWVGRNPLATRNVQFGLLQQQFGGDRSRIGRALMRSWGLEAWQAGAVYDVYAGAPEGGVSQEMIDEAMTRESRGVGPVAPDPAMNVLTRLMQLQMLRGVGKTALRALEKLFGGFGGGAEAGWEQGRIDIEQAEIKAGKVYIQVGEGDVTGARARLEAGGMDRTSHEMDLTVGAYGDIEKAKRDVRILGGGSATRLLLTALEEGRELTARQLTLWETIAELLKRAPAAGEGEEKYAELLQVLFDISAKMVEGQ